MQLHASDSNLLQVPATVTILAGQTTVAFDALGKGNRCAFVDLTASADAHLADTWAVEIYAPPQLSSLTPQQAQVCDTTTLTVLGNCFKEEETSVRAIRNGVLQPLPVVSMTSTQIVVEVSGLDT